MKELTKHTYHIAGMSCSGCVSTIKNKLSNTTGVTSVNIDLGNKQVEINSPEEIKIDILRNALNKTRYTISELES